MHDVDIEDIRGRSIKSNLEEWNYIYLEGKFKLNI